MGVLIEGSYLGKLKTRLVHSPSGSEVRTDAPRDNGGEGSLFSPTDMVAGALGACMMTILGLVGDRLKLDLTGMTVRVEKVMRAEPRRIGCLLVELTVPAGVPQEHRPRIEAAVRACPVAQSLHPDVEVRTEFVYTK
jgi:putative redox protein